MRPLFFAAFLARRRRHGWQSVMRATLFGTRFAGFLLWNCHFKTPVFQGVILPISLRFARKKVVIGR